MTAWDGVHEGRVVGTSLGRWRWKHPAFIGVCTCGWQSHVWPRSEGGVQIELNQHLTDAHLARR